jgi:hypothetical protein
MHYVMFQDILSTGTELVLGSDQVQQSGSQRPTGAYTLCDGDSQNTTYISVGAPTVCGERRKLYRFIRYLLLQ